MELFIHTEKLMDGSEVHDVVLREPGLADIHFPAVDKRRAEIFRDGLMRLASVNTIAEIKVTD